MKKIRQVILSALKTVPKLIPDILALMGAMTISYGAYLIFIPMGFITLGIMLIAIAVILSKS